MKADFHNHTKRSIHKILPKGFVDAINTPNEMVSKAVQVGLDCICITDHGAALGIKKARELSKKYNVLVISGGEFMISGKEYIALNIDDQPKGETIEEVHDYVKDENVLLVAPHPFDIFRRGFSKFEYFDAIEVLNGYGTEIKDISKIKSPVTGSDAHSVFHLGYSYTDVKTNGNDVDDLLTAVKKGLCVPHGKPFPKWLALKVYPYKYAMWAKNVFSYLK